VLESRDASVWEGFVHGVHAPPEQAWIQVRAPPEDAVGGFLKDLGAPQRAEDVVFSQTKQEIAEDLWVKDVGV
jgi:hypothetical protein